MNPCANCGTSTTNPKFCSRSCSAVVNNRTPKRKRTVSLYNCASCGEEIPHSRSRCGKPECRPNYVDWSRVTFGEVRGRRNYQSHSRNRTLSRRAYLNSDKPQECAVCGYSTYFEVCHIRALSDFSDDATVAEANDLSNLVALCRNHHWELDNGLLRLKI